MNRLLAIAALLLAGMAFVLAAMNSFGSRSVAAVDQINSSSQSQLDTVLKRGKLVVATYSASPPLAYIDENGKLVGFEIDLARAIAKDLFGDPNKVEFVVVSANGRFPAVASGKADFGMCSTTITGDRAARIAFSEPYLDTAGAIIARRDAALTHASQLNDKKYTFAILNNPGSIEHAAEAIPRARSVIFDSPAGMLLATKTGRATAFSIDKAIADRYVADNTDLMLLDTHGTSFDSIAGDGFYMRPGDFKWWLFLDTWVRELKRGSRYAQYQGMYRKWLGKDPPPQRLYDVQKY